MLALGQLLCWARVTQGSVSGPPTPELASLGVVRTVTSQRAAGKLQGLWGSCQRSRKGFLEEVMLELGPEG